MKQARMGFDPRHTGGVKVQSEVLDELALRVSKHGDLVANVQVLAPGIHDKSVVDRDASDQLDALVLQFIVMLEVTGDVGLCQGQSVRDLY